MRSPTRRPSRALLAAALPLVLAAAACRNADESDTTSGFVALLPSRSGANGCSGPDQVFAAPQTPSAVALAVLGIGPSSQVTADATEELLYATGAGATVVEIDVSAGALEAELVGTGVVAALLTGAGIATAPELSGIAVLDATTLLVVERTSNTILAVDRATPDTVVFFAGEPQEGGGFADGLAIPGSAPGFGPARFSFDRPTQVCPTGSSDGRVLVADPGNHAVRMIVGGFVSTVAGSGAPFFQDGDLTRAGFDTPVGLTVSCSRTLLVAETGASGSGGHRLRRLVQGEVTFFGPTGSVNAVAGDGVGATTGGDGLAAQLAAPLSPLSTSGRDTYWIDSGTGILRRLAGAMDTVDCPLWADCATAVAMGGNFSSGGHLSLTQTPAGVLYVLDAPAATLWRVTP
jgi:hypothetical protein